MPADFTMVLVRIIPAVSENKVRIYPRLEALEPTFDLFTLGGKKTVSELRHLDPRAGGGVEEVVSRLSRFVLSRTYSTQHAPQHIKAVALCNPRQQRAASANLDIVGMSPQAQNGPAIRDLAETQRLHG
jgi:hypothetical protein